MHTSQREHQSIRRALDENALWVLVRVGDEHLVMLSTTVLEMVRSPVAHKVPFASPVVRGVAQLRGQVGLVIDMRTRLGLESLKQERTAVSELLTAREHEHLVWLDDLEASVREKREFTRTLDPHQCAFGRWYDTYKAPTLELEWHLRQFAGPHQRIHEVGATAIDLMRHDKADEAAALIEWTRDSVLARLRELFEGARCLLTEASREIAVIVNAQGRSVGLAVDEVEGIDQLKPDTLEQLPDGFASGDPAIAGTARTRRDDRVVVVVDLDMLTRDFARQGDAA